MLRLLMVVVVVVVVVATSGAFNTLAAFSAFIVNETSDETDRIANDANGGVACVCSVIMIENSVLMVVVAN